MDTLVVYELIPEDTRIFVVPDAPEWLDLCHGVIVNSSNMSDEQDAAMARLHDAIQKNPKWYQEDEEKHPERGQWVAHEVGVFDDNGAVLPPTVHNGPLKVVFCGFYL